MYYNKPINGKYNMNYFLKNFHFNNIIKTQQMDNYNDMQERNYSQPNNENSNYTPNQNNLNYNWQNNNEGKNWNLYDNLNQNNQNNSNLNYLSNQNNQNSELFNRQNNSNLNSPNIPNNQNWEFSNTPNNQNWNYNNQNNINKNLNSQNNQNYNYNNSNYIYKRDAQYMREIYSNINSILYPYVVKTLDEYEYVGSPIYSYSGLDKETLSQLIDRVIIISRPIVDEIDEIYLDQNSIISVINDWDRWKILRSNIESLLLTDIYTIRRPKYFNNYTPNMFY